MAHILILSLIFPPDNVSTAHIIGEVAGDLVAAGHRVTAVTTTPHYNPDDLAEREQPLRPWLGPLVKRSELGSIPVFHVAMPRKGRTLIGRVLPWIGFHLVGTLVAAVKVRDVDVILTPSPPLTMGVGAWLVGLRHRAPFIYNVQELYPDLAVRLGALRNRFLIRVLLRLERFVYSRAAAVTVISNRIEQQILAKGPYSEKVHHIPNFVDVDHITPRSRQNPFSTAHSLDGRFVVSYAGNMGRAQDLDLLVDVAEKTAHDDRIHYVLVGGGVERGRLERRVWSSGLHNVSILPQQPYSVVPDIYGASDLCFVPLRASLESEALPSKVYRIMSAARPILASTTPGSELDRLIEDAECGISVTDPGVDALAAAITEACGNLDALGELGRSGRRYVQRHFSRPVVTRRYLDLVDSLARRE